MKNIIFQLKALLNELLKVFSIGRPKKYIRKYRSAENTRVLRACVAEEPIESVSRQSQHVALE